MAASFTTGVPSTFGRFDKAGFECPAGYSSTSFNTPSASTFGGYPTEWSSRFGGNTFGGYPSWGNFGGSNTFGGYPTEWSSRFGGNTSFGGYPWGNFGSFGGYPTEWSSRFGGNFGGNTSFGGYPWGNFGSFGGYPTEWSSRFGGNNTFGGYPNEWASRFGGNFGGNTSFGGYPWGNFGSYESFPWSRSGSEMTPFGAAPWSRFGGESTTYPWTRDVSSRFNVPTSWFGNNFDWANWERQNFDEFERSLFNVSRELFNLKNIFDFGKRKEATTGGNRGAYSTSMVQLPSRPTSSIEYYTFQNPIRFDANGNRWLSLCFDLPSFKPEEITVTLYSKATPAPYIEVLASHDVKDTKEHNIKRTYERKYFFPADLYLKPEDIAKLEIKSHFTNEGCLYIEAQLPRVTPEEARKERTHYPVWSVPIKTEKKDM